MRAAPQKEVPIKRLRDLLALSRSPNIHEAANAKNRLDELLARHGMTEADLVESTTEVASLPQAKEGNQRQELARIIATSRGVAAKTKQHHIAFVGYPEAAKDACQLFCALNNIVEQQAEMPIGQNPAAEYLWRMCFWLGFVEAIQKQLDPEHTVPPEALNVLLQKAAAPPDIERAAQAFGLVREQLSIRKPDSAHQITERFKQLAHDSGFKLGTQIPAPLYRGKRG